MTSSSRFRDSLLLSVVVGALAALAGGAAADGSLETTPQASSADSCPDGFPRGAPTQVLEKLAVFTPSPADVAVCPNGDVFLTLDGPDQIWRVPVGPGAGAPERYAAVTGVQPAGIACDARGRLFVAAFSLRKGSPYPAPGILVFENAQTPPRHLAKLSGGGGFVTPNGVAAAAGIGIYVSDTLTGNIVLVREQDGQYVSTVVARNMLGVNGLGFDGAARRLVASNSLSQAVVSLDVAADGTLGQPRRIWAGPFGAMLDEVEVDDRGKVYVAAYGLGQVYRLPEAEIVARVTNPASLAFRGGRLLVVDYHLNQPTLEGGLYAVNLGACRAP